MASNASPEASEIRRRGRRRLIGAIALVVLAVVFVPMLLDSEPRKSREGPSAAIPPKDNAPPLPAPPKAAQPEPAKVAVSTPAAESKVTVPPPPSTPKAAPEPVTAAKAGAQPSEPAKLQGFAVQVGAFRDEAKLKQSRDKLAAAGVTHYTERLEAKAGPLTRLRAGPYATRAEAEAALAKLKGAAIEGKVVPLP